jgi:hypothetical protein
MSSLSVYKRIIPVIAVAVSALGSVPAKAADMVTYYAQPSRTHVVRAHHARVVRTTYLARRTHCDDNVIEYRYPYIPHIEIVRVCNRYRY